MFCDLDLQPLISDYLNSTGIMWGGVLSYWSSANWEDERIEQ